MIKVKNISKYFGNFRAVNNLTFTVRKGEILGLLGPNGAGKTSVLRMIACYMPPTSGSIIVSGFDCVNQSLQARELIGYLPENAPLYNDLRVIEYLKFMTSFHQIKNPGYRIDYVLDQVGLTSRSEHIIGTLSRGLRQRLGLAQALVHDPPILILDEPTIGLDPAQIKEVRDLIIKLGAKKTIILSTHILTEVEQVCDRVLIINKGEIVAENSPQKISSLFSGNKVLSVRYKGKIDHVLDRLLAIPGIANITAKESDILEIETFAGNNVSPSVAKCLIGGGIDLYEMNYVDHSFEDVFLSLTRDQVPSPQIDGGMDASK